VAGFGAPLITIDRPSSNIGQSIASAASPIFDVRADCDVVADDRANSDRAGHTPRLIFSATQWSRRCLFARPRRHACPRRDTLVMHMSRAPSRIAPALLTILVLGLSLQAAIWCSLPGAGSRGDWVLAAGASIACLVLGFHLVRSALLSLATEAARLQELAIGWETADALSAPSLAEHDSSLREIEGLRAQLLARLQEEQRLRKQVEDASAFKTGFLRSVRHELRTPLNAVLGFSEVLLSGMEGPLTAGQRENLLVIERTGRRLSSLFDEVIELAAMVAGQLELRSDAVDVTAVLERVGEAAEEDRGPRPVHIRIDAPETGLVIEGDGVRIERLLRGIATHALSLLHGELLVLSARAEGEQVKLSARDPARRLSREEVEMLTGSEPTSMRRKGLDESSRLRIVIWRQLAHVLGGSFELHSGAEGTVCELSLPAWRQA
jgi:signal transduction histidine kinase